MNEIESHGGVDTSDQASKGFSSVTDYFQAVAQQDADHLDRQPNSIDDDEDARRKYLRNHFFKAIAPTFVDPRYNDGPFKLLCDDFRFGNLLVNNAQDLKIVAVLVWEWAYAAPFQLFYSPPRWLLIKKPLDWDDQDQSRYNILLKLLIEIPAEEESKRAQKCSTPSIATLMRESMDDGKFWFHELIYSCFESPDNRAWSAIEEFLPSVSELANIPASEIKRFVKNKLEQLKEYNEEWAAMKRELDRKEAEFQAPRERVEKEDIQGSS